MNLVGFFVSVDKTGLMGKGSRRRILYSIYVLYLFALPICEELRANPHCAAALVASFDTRPRVEGPSLISDLKSPGIQTLREEVAAVDVVLFLLDHDGTFKAHEANSELVWPSPRESRLLTAFEAHPKFQFYFVTGRPMDWFFQRYGSHKGIGISANHGVVEKKIHESTYMPLHGLPEDWREALPLLEEYRNRIPDSRIEIKLGFVFHWKEAERHGPEALLSADEFARGLYAQLIEKFAGRPVRFAWSDKGRYFEILPDDSRMGKGEAVLRILRHYLGDDLKGGKKILVITAGDEGSDNEMHSVARELAHQGVLRAFSIKVGDNQLDRTSAAYWMKTPAELQGLLEEVLRIQSPVKVRVGAPNAKNELRAD